MGPAADLVSTATSAAVAHPFLQSSPALAAVAADVERRKLYPCEREPLWEAALEVVCRAQLRLGRPAPSHAVLEGMSPAERELLGRTTRALARSLGRWVNRADEHGQILKRGCSGGCSAWRVALLEVEAPAFSTVAKAIAAIHNARSLDDLRSIAYAIDSEFRRRGVQPPFIFPPDLTPKRFGV